MLELFSDQAKEAIFGARYEASAFGASEIDSDHLLLGLIRSDSTLLPAVQAKTTSYLEFRDAFAKLISPQEPTSPTGDMPITQRIRDAFLIAKKKADGAHAKHIGTAHLLFGLLQQPYGEAARLLMERG